MKCIILSSFAQDRLICDNAVEERNGGPALFITEVFERAHEQYILYATQGIVEIDCRGGEQGRILCVDPLLPQDDSNFAGADLCLISTLLDECPVQAFGRISCLDVQGYVRKYRESKDGIFDIAELERFTIVKATREELQFLDEFQLNRVPVLLITDGAAGGEIRSQRGTIPFTVEVLQVPDTIGAGDTFFASFCLTFARTSSIQAALDSAKDETKSFLLRKAAGAR